MRRFWLLSICLPALCLPQARSQETHLSEQGSGAIFSRSAFAHGYRHGYEEGYHLGNIDANFAHLARTKKSQFHGLRLGYSSEFGSKKSFEEGFQSGVLAGYGDGYAGRNFRAVDSMRTIATSLEEEEAEASDGQAKAGSFDQGLACGKRRQPTRLESHWISTASAAPSVPRKRKASLPGREVTAKATGAALF